ncbi:unnamed protein product [Cyprideis torosa]|uniref:Uncharacterized protein n=1 Tax=Cyprideis torosa TaxID=163714 RepID=A0A7R8WKE3_9CRUS|nr:unnamed protein product [Cyprideis torosa]CAG0900357.1 unnamed protein product [Cyprideis torosa]
MISRRRRARPEIPGGVDGEPKRQLQRRDREEDHTDRRMGRILAIFDIQPTRERGVPDQKKEEFDLIIGKCSTWLNTGTIGDHIGLVIPVACEDEEGGILPESILECELDDAPPLPPEEMNLAVFHRPWLFQEEQIACVDPSPGFVFEPTASGSVQEEDEDDLGPSASQRSVSLYDHSMVIRNERQMKEIRIQIYLRAIGVRLPLDASPVFPGLVFLPPSHIVMKGGRKLTEDFGCCFCGTMVPRDTVFGDHLSRCIGHLLTYTCRLCRRKTLSADPRDIYAGALTRHRRDCAFSPSNRKMQNIPSHLLSPFDREGLPAWRTVVTALESPLPPPASAAERRRLEQEAEAARLHLRQQTALATRLSVQPGPRGEARGLPWKRRKRLFQDKSLRLQKEDLNCIEQLLRTRGLSCALSDPAKTQEDTAKTQEDTAKTQEDPAKTQEDPAKTQQEQEHEHEVIDLTLSPEPPCPSPAVDRPSRCPVSCPCPFCGRHMCALDDLLCHMQWHMCIRSSRCPLCLERIPSLPALVSHVRLQHQHYFPNLPARLFKDVILIPGFDVVNMSCKDKDNYFIPTPRIQGKACRVYLRSSVMQASGSTIGAIGQWRWAVTCKTLGSVPVAFLEAPHHLHTQL